MAGLSGFSYYKTITISKTNVSADVNNFPVFIPIVSDADIGAACRADGFDVQFANADNSAALTFERLTGFAVASGEASGDFYVLVPTVTTADDTVIRCYYGNAGASVVGQFKIFGVGAKINDDTPQRGMGKTGVEPARPEGHQVGNLACLPIPSFPHQKRVQPRCQAFP
jgi:hypothetical protein